MPKFIPRFEAPDNSNKYYYSDNVFYQSGYGMPNCTAYAWGRFYELSGQRPKLCTANAEYWYDYNDGYKRGQTPKLGAIIVWSGGNLGAGHVAVVEAINEDGSITTSNSAYNSTYFYTQGIGNTYALSGYTFLGFIYNPVDFEGSGGSTTLEPISGNRYLSMSEMQNNAEIVYRYLVNKGFTVNAISAMLGNMQTESTINAGIWENLDESMPLNLGCSLVGWTPATKYLNWCTERGLQWDNLYSALDRIVWEFENGEQWLSSNGGYSMKQSDFKTSTADIEYLANVFLYQYENPAVLPQPARAEQAMYWYNFCMNLPNNPIEPTKPTKKGLSLLMMYLATRK